MELDLKIWKELAIKKQMLMRAVTDALGLSPEASEEEIEAGIRKGVKQIADTAAIVAKLASDHRLATGELQHKLEQAKGWLATAEARIADLAAEKDSLQNSFNAARDASAVEALNLKSQLEIKTRELKGINSVLGDSPENVAKKMKALNKKKHDATESYKRAETDLKNVTKEKRVLQQALDAEKEKTETLTKEVEAQKAATEESGENQQVDTADAVDVDSHADKREPTSA